MSQTPESKRAKIPNESLRERLAIFESEAAQSAAERDEAQRIAQATVASIQSEELRISRQAEARVGVLVSEMNADSARKGTERAQKAAAEHQEMVHLVEQARRERGQAVSAADRAVSDAATEAQNAVLAEQAKARSQMSTAERAVMEAQGAASRVEQMAELEIRRPRWTLAAKTT